MAYRFFPSSGALGTDVLPEPTSLPCAHDLSFLPGGLLSVVFSLCLYSFPPLLLNGIVRGLWKPTFPLYSWVGSACGPFPFGCPSTLRGVLSSPSLKGRFCVMPSSSLFFPLSEAFLCRVSPPSASVTCPSQSPRCLVRRRFPQLSFGVLG